MQEVSDTEFANEVTNHDGRVLVDFYADWCGPCKVMKPALEKFSESHGDSVKVVGVNVDENPELAAAHGVQSIPNLVLFDAGETVDRKVGVMSIQRLEDWLLGKGEDS